MFVHVGKTYYALEAKTMATDDFLPGPPSWDCDCYSGGPPEPPPLFHLPPPPKPPGINGPLEHSLADDCNGPWTCPALALEAGTSFGSSQDGSLPRASPEVSMPAIIISASVLGLFFFIAAVIFVRMWRSYKAASKKASCDLDAADLYEDLPVAPPLLPGPLHMAHNNCPQALRIKNDGFGHHMGALPQLPDNQTHVYSPEPRTETPSDHLYHHISSGSETFSFSTGEAPSNALLPQNLHLIHNEEDEVCCSSSAHSYNSSATGTPTSSPTPAHSQNPSGRFVRGVNLNGPPIVSMLPGFPSGHCSGTRHKHVNGGGHHVASLLPSSVYSINHCLDNQQHNPAANKHSDNMVPLAQIYSPGSHLYEAATLIRPSGDHTASNCSMVHWGNVPAPYVDAPYLAKPTKHSNNKRDNKNVPFVHNTMAHPLEYGAKNVAVHHGCPMRQYSPQHGPGVIQFHPLMVHAHQTHVHEFPQQYYLQHSNHLPLPLNSSTLMPNAKLAKSMYDMARSKDITPTNSDPIDSLYNTSPHSDLDLIATTCFSTQASLPNQNEYQTALDAYNLNVLPGQRHRLPEDSLHGMGVSDSSGSSHPSSSNDGAAVTESSSLNSSGTSSSTLPLSTPLNNTMRRDLPPLPSRADRYRIYAQNNEAGFANRSNTCRRSANNNSGDSTASDSSRNFKSCDDLKNVSTVDNSRVSLRQNGNECGRRGMDDPNVANNNLVSDGAVQIDASDNCSLDEMEPEIVRSSRAGFLKSSNNSRKSTPKKKRRGHVDEVSEEYEEDVLYDHCGDT
ncbi:uncharacterized protein LOC108680113 isoform X2 [Hyalella azteca]|uniref:Uncharacterized protein LOC108680113 isoform X2 n=1 Tax=Hyalella azteca TaxID=294128 RepID=A0A979FGU2_HYAAZ|nr:uncharacterized protein LOC108680113 isoform X2 [Hyalella azteca]